MGGLFAEGFAGFEEFFLQIENASAGVQADAQFVSVERLRKVVIGAGSIPSIRSCDSVRAVSKTI